MNTPAQTLAPIDTQGGLFYQPPLINCTSCASARNAYGYAAQELVYALLGVSPIRINGSFTTCFDGFKDNTYFEIKSTNLKSGKVVLYDWRMKKEAEAGVSLSYLVVCHSLSGHRTDILQSMADLPIVIYSIPAPVVHALASTCKLNTLKRKDVYGLGYERAGYRDGYRNLALSQIVSALRFEEQLVVNGLGSGTVVLRTCREGDAMQ